jgi:hypothetical protein
MDEFLISNAEALNSLPIEERALIPGGLPEELKIMDIAKLTYPEKAYKQEAWVKVLVDA